MTCTVKYICQNGETLKVLNLDFCTGLSLESIRHITDYCPHLTEVNLHSTNIDNKDVRALVMNSKNLEELNLRYEKHFKACNFASMHTTLTTNSIFSDLRYTAITMASVTSIIRHSSSTLKKLDLSYTCVAKVV